MKHATLILSLFVFGSTLPSLAQTEKTITVRVVDNMTKQPVAGVEVSSNEQKTTTNALGFFQLTVAPGAPLVLTHEKYRKLELSAPEQEKFQLAIDLRDDLVEFSDGVASFYKHISNKIEYPLKARQQKVQANVWVEMLIGDDGKTQFVKAHNDVSQLFEPTLKKSINSLGGKWNESYKGMIFLLPVRFQLASEPSIDPFETLTIPKHRVMVEMVVTAYAVSR